MGTNLTESAVAGDLLDDRRLAQRLGIPERLPAQWRYRGEGPPFIKVGPRHVRYREADVEAWLDAQTHRPGSSA